MTTATTEEVDGLIRQGVMALKSGDRERAWNLLATAIKQDRRNQSAWFYMAEATTNPEETRTCYERVVDINSDNDLGQRAANWLGNAHSGETAPSANSVMQPDVNTRDVSDSPVMPPAPVVQSPPIVSGAESKMTAAQSVVQVRLSPGMLWAVVSLLFVLVALNAYTLFMSYQMQQIEAHRAATYEERIAEAHERAQAQRELIGDLIESYDKDVYDNPGIDRISEQQLIAAEYTIQLLRLISIQNSDMIDLLVEQP